MFWLTCRPLAWPRPGCGFGFAWWA